MTFRLPWVQKPGRIPLHPHATDSLESALSATPAELQVVYLTRTLFGLVRVRLICIKQWDRNDTG